MSGPATLPAVRSKHGIWLRFLCWHREIPKGWYNSTFPRGHSTDLTLFFKATLKPEGSKMLFPRLTCLSYLRIWVRGPLLDWGFQSATGLYCHTSPCGRLLIDTRELIKQRWRTRRQERQKSNRFRPTLKTTTLHAHRAFLYISSPNFTFCWGRDRRQRLSLSFPERWYSL